MNAPWELAARWVVTLLVPIALVMAGVRLLITPLFLQFEYRAPFFPEDRYGFTLDDRLKWSKIALDYLLNDEGISFLGDLKFENGEPVYNARELRHMVDVKNVLRVALWVWYGALALLVGMGIWAWGGGWWQEFRQAISTGGLLTMFLIGVVVLFVIVAFGVIFVAFHNIFFQPGTWQFLYSDTLIRLFPERFWRDCFLLVGAFSILFGNVLRVLFRLR